MPDIDERLRADLRAAADTVVVPSLPSGDAYRQRARRQRHRVMQLVAAAAATALVLTGIATVAMHRPTGLPPANGGPAAWPTRGALAGDASLAAAAVQTWDAAPLPKAELPHHDVHVLFAGKSVAGKTVVLSGTDALGHARVAWLNTDATSKTAFRHRLHLVADKLLEDPEGTSLVGFYGFRPTPRPSNDKLLIAIGPPGTASLQWSAQGEEWRRVPTTNGAGLLVHPSDNDLLDVSLRAGDSGSGTRTLNEAIALHFGQIDHDPDPSELPPSTASCHNGVCSASAGGMVAAVPSRESGDLRFSGGIRMRDSKTRVGGWGEFAAEALLMAQRRPPATGYSYGETWSGLLPDDTGLYLLRYQSGDNPMHLLLYVDRPEWLGGRLGADVTATEPVPALGALIPGRSGMELAVVLTDGLHAQWRAGRGSWHDMTAHHRAAVAEVSSWPPATIRYRVVDDSGTVRAEGKPSASALG